MHNKGSSISTFGLSPEASRRLQVGVLALIGFVVIVSIPTFVSKSSHFTLTSSEVQHVSFLVPIRGQTSESVVPFLESLYAADWYGYSASVCIIVDLGTLSTESEKQNIRFLEEAIENLISPHAVIDLSIESSADLRCNLQLRSGDNSLFPAIILQSNLLVPRNFLSQLFNSTSELSLPPASQDPWDPAGVIVLNENSGDRQSSSTSGGAQCARLGDAAVALVYPNAWQAILRARGRDGGPSEEGRGDAMSVRWLEDWLVLRGTRVWMLPWRALARVTFTPGSRWRTQHAVDEAAITPMKAPVCVNRDSFASKLYAHNESGLAAVLRSVAHNNTVVVSMINAGIAVLFRNWLCYIRRMHVPNVLIYSIDTTLKSELAERGVPAYIPDEIPGLPEGGRSKLRKWGSLPYQRIILARTRFVGHVLALGYNVLLVDVDAVWLKNPLEYLEDGESSGYDMEAQMDSESVCGGFLYLRNTVAMRALWQQLITDHQDLVDRATAHGKLFRDKDSEQALLQKHINDGKVKLRELDRLLFPYGKKYFEVREPQSAGVVPAVVHNNYIQGTGRKIDRFKAEQLWALTSDNSGCRADW